MSERYKVQDSQWPHFITITTERWIDVFTRVRYKDIFVDSLNYCVRNKGLKVHAWVLMTNHAHLIVSSETTALEDIIRDMKTFTSKMLLKDIQANTQESRDWMMYFFQRAGEYNSSNTHFQFWQNGYHPVHLWNDEMLLQRLNYTHQNPVRAGFVNDSWEWKYSNALDYSGNKGLIEIEMLSPFVLKK